MQAFIFFIFTCCLPSLYFANEVKDVVQDKDFIMNCYNDPSNVPDDYFIGVTYSPSSGTSQNVLQYRPKENSTFEEPTSPFYKRITFTKNRELVLHNVKVADEGTFSCVSHAFGLTSTTMSMGLVVLVPPLIELTKMVDPLVAGSNQINAAQCTARDGKPESTVTWSTTRHLEFNSTESENTGSAPLTSTTVSILYVIPTEFYNDQPFVCTVTHPAFTTPEGSTINLNVQFPPKKPSITVRDSGTVLHCSSEGNPEPTLVWSLPPVAPAPTQTGATVKIIGPQDPERQNDTYTCTASNGVGQSAFASITTSKASTIVTMVNHADTGLIVGIVIGCLLLLVIVGALVYWFFIRRTKDQDSGPYNPKLSSNTSSSSPWGRSGGKPTIEHANESLNRNRPPSPNQPPPHDEEDHKGSVSSQSDMEEEEDGHDVHVVPLVQGDGYEDMPESGIVSKNSVSFRQRRQRPSTSPHRRSQKNYPEPSPRAAPQSMSQDHSPDNPQYEVPPMDYYQDEPYDDEEVPLAHEYPQQQPMDDRFYDLPENRYPRSYQERYDGGLPPYTHAPEVQYTSIDHSYNEGRQRPPSHEPVEYAEIRSHGQIV